MTRKGQPDLRDRLRRNKLPLYYFSPSAFNLLGADACLGDLTLVNTVDSFAGDHPRVFVPPGALDHGLRGIEAGTNYLLRHPAVADRVRRSVLDSRGGALFLMFDAHAEALARDLGLGIAFPPVALRRRLDSKVTTTMLADRAGVPSVPNVLARVDSYDALRSVAGALGPDLVIQLPYGDSGTTTFFVSEAADFDVHADAITAEPVVKIMRRIRPRQATIEGCVTRHGTLVGPLMTEMVGFAALTPHGGGWCGNEVFGAAAVATFPPAVREQVASAVEAIGKALREEGYWGVFGLDFLADEETGALYLGEMNPRITGATPLTSLAALDIDELPLILFHVAEWLGVEYAVDVEALNRRWREGEGTQSWSQLIIEHVGDAAVTVEHVPAAGVWRMDGEGTVRFGRRAIDPRAVAGETEAFVLSTVDPGHRPERGQSLGRLLTRGRLMTDGYRLTERAHAWIAGVRSAFGYRPATSSDVA